MTTLDFNSYKLMLINRIAVAEDIQAIKDAFANTACNVPCSWTREELESQLQKSEEEIKAGRCMSGQKAVAHFRERRHGSKMVG